MWNVKATVILKITGATGCLSLSFQKHLDIPGKHSGMELQKSDILETAYILKKILT
jgi:hypothetical protein